jgi:hypothetical protein
MNVTVTLTPDELRALYTALELFDADRDALIEEDDTWEPTFASIDSFYRKVVIEKTIQDLAEEHPNASRTLIRKHVVKTLKENGDN